MKWSTCRSCRSGRSRRCATRHCRCALATPRRQRGDRLQRGQRAAAADAAAAWHSVRHARRRAGVEAGQVGPGRASATTGWPRAGRALVRRLDRRRQGHRRSTTATSSTRRPVQIAYGAPMTDAGRRPARRAGSEAEEVPLGRRPLRAGEPCAGDRARLPAEPGPASAGRGRVGAVRRRLHRRHQGRARPSRSALLGGVWDQTQLDQLYANALTYLHGHSVGGTNPSLLRATGAGCFTLANDVMFNREVLGDRPSTGAVPSRSPRRSSGPKPTPMRWSPEARR